MVLSRIGVLSAAKLGAIVYAFLGLLVGAFMSMLAMMGFLASRQDGAGAVGIFMGAGAIILLPIFYGFLGFIFGAIGAVFYNLAAQIAGGLELETINRE